MAMVPTEIKPHTPRRLRAALSLDSRHWRLYFLNLRFAVKAAWADRVTVF